MLRWVLHFRSGRACERGFASVFLVAIVGVAVVSAAGIGGYIYWMSRQTQVAVAPVVKVSPTLPTNPVPKTETAPKKAINTLEEAMAFALTGSGLENVDSAKVRSAKATYTSTMKTWVFEFVTRTNPHPSPKTGVTVYDEPWPTVKVDSTGNFSVSTTMTTKDNEQNDTWAYLAKPSEMVASANFDLAKQKVVAAGLTPGTIIYAEFSSLGTASDTDGLNNEWDISVVLSGEEGNSQKKAKRVVIRNGIVKTISDSAVMIY